MKLPNILIKVNYINLILYIIYTIINTNYSKVK